MKLAKRFAALILGSALAVGGTFGLASCGGNETGAEDDSIRAVYSLYVENCAANDTVPQTYEEWLASIKGEKGEDGVTPHVGDDGYWWIGSKRTDVKAQGEKGEDGVSPHIDEESGNWFIGEEDTHIPATGPQGNGEDGADGTSFRHGHGAPAADLGIVGDLYLDIDTWDVYERTADGWSEDPIGNIKGAKGDPGSGGAEPSEIKVDITAGGSQEISVAGLSQGVHIIKADLGAVKLSTGRIQVQAGEGGVTSEVVFSQTRTDAAGGSNIYYGYLVVTEGISAATVSAIGEDVSATITFEEYEAPVIEWGVAVEVPVNPINSAEGNLVKFKLGADISGSCNCTITADAAYSSQVELHIGGSSLNIRTFNRAWKGTIDGSALAPEGGTSVYLASSTVTAPYANVIIPVTFTIAVAA